MKKIYLLISALGIAMSAGAQTIPNAGMEVWRTNTSGASTPKVVRAPADWYGADSLIIAIGEALGSFAGIDDSVWKQQLFKDSTTVHGGSYAARLVTADQDTAGIFPGILSNAKANVPFSSSGIGTITYSGGTPTTYHIMSVSAWVKYVQGGALDSGTLSVQAMGNISGIDSVLASKTITIGPSSTYTQVTANLTYAHPELPVDTIRITFTSSAGPNNAVGSTLYVDDVTMAGWPAEVYDASTANVVKIYPNPANVSLQLDANSAEALTFSLMAVNGQVAGSKTFNGKTSMDLASIANGMYTYVVADKDGKIVQKGKVNVVK